MFASCEVKVLFLYCQEAIMVDFYVKEVWI